MNAVELIRKKRDGQRLARPELEFLVRHYLEGKIPDYQMAAFCMAVYFRSMDVREITDFTQIMADSGDRLSHEGFDGFIADKHSTGGVGDKVSLVLVPLIAACGLYMPKLSGRGLGYTGGTIDKLEAIPGFRAPLTLEELKRCLCQAGAAISESTFQLAPADQKLYALRDVTASVESLPLIVSSILSKKLVIDSDGLVFDVKVGSGAMMRALSPAKALAGLLVSIAKRCGRRAVALITDMSQPLGYNVGNALELKEALATLQSHGPADLTEIVLRLGSELLVMAKQARTVTAGWELLRRKLLSGEGLHKFSEMVRAQGGDADVVRQPHRLSCAREKLELKAKKTGWVGALDARLIGEAAHSLGAGRAAMGERIDHAVGVELFKKIGDQVTKGEPLACLHVNEQTHWAEAMARVESAFQIGRIRPRRPALVRGRVA
jgi:pyrimidine-nucleoside phosphorylase